MATRERQATAAADKAARQAALRTLDGQPLPLPTDPHTTPPEPSDDLAAEIHALGSCGLTPTQIAHHLATTEGGLTRMGKAHPAVEAALSRARTAAKAWWEEQARRALITENNRFPAGAWAQVMKARFPDYDDKPTFVIDLGSLVRIDVQPTANRLPDTDKPLIEGQTVRLGQGPTGPGSVDLNLLSAPDVTTHDTEADALDAPPATPKNA